MHSLWLVQSGIKRLETKEIQLVINSIRHKTNLTLIALEQNFNFSYYKLGIKKKKKRFLKMRNWKHELETKNMNYIVKNTN